MTAYWHSYRPRPVCLYLGWSRAAALADFITGSYGLEPPLDFPMPIATFLPEEKPRFGIGEKLPARWLVEAAINWDAVPPQHRKAYGWRDEWGDPDAGTKWAEAAAQPFAGMGV